MSQEQRTKCAVCGQSEHTPIRIDSMGGYVCLSCVEAALLSLQRKNEELVKAARAEAFEAAARVAERDADWTLFWRAKRPDALTGEETNLFAITPEEMDPSEANVMAYRLGIAAGKTIAAAIRRSTPEAP